MSLEGVWSSMFPCVPRSRNCHRVQSNVGGALQRFQRQGVGSVELQVVCPTLPVVSCFSNCGFGVGFTSHWLWDPVGAFWGPLIFLFQGS
jgi:hypothetical protein